MAVPVAAILKKVAVAVGSNKNVLKTVCGIVLGIVVIVCMPIIALLGIFSGDTEIVIDTGPIYDWVEEGQPEFESTFQEVEEKMGEGRRGISNQTARSLPALPRENAEKMQQPSAEKGEVEVRERAYRLFRR